MGALAHYLKKIDPLATVATPATYNHEQHQESQESQESRSAINELKKMLDPFYINGTGPTGLCVKPTLVTCGTCQHCIPSTLNPGAGWGRCTVSPKHGDFPRRRHECPDFAPQERMEVQSERFE